MSTKFYVIGSVEPTEMDSLRSGADCVIVIKLKEKCLAGLFSERTKFTALGDQMLHSSGSEETKGKWTLHTEFLSYVLKSIHGQ